MARILVSGVSVDFPLYHGSSRSLKKTVFAAASGHINRDRQSRAVVSALREIGFQLLTGDRLGLVGGNGAGKTTLLRVLAGIYEPVAGHVRVEGSLTALIDPNLGMNQDLTGRENILLRGLYGGLTRAAIRQLEEDIRDFTELGQFLDLPVRLYSSGMMVRLGFALATAVHPQVLLMDEWFLAGDSAFMRKARGRLENMVRGAELLVLSSHEVAVLQAWCTRVIWLDHGRVRADGSPQEVLDRYLGHPRPARATYETVSPERREAAESTKIGTSLGEMEGDGGRAIKGREQGECTAVASS
ncbi:MAG TPA: ABC transporter ATP-binding protein [Acetobacteraceae bacterium]|nr:ABC transporter ATP-binding protein [Acetobacteraceae bacterium]